MANQSDLLGVGLSWPAAERLGYTPTTYTANAGVTAQSGAKALGSKLALLSVASATGNAFLLPANPPTGIIMYCTNLFASVATAQVFAATNNLLNGTTNTALTLTTGQSAVFISVAAGTAAACNWYSIKTA